MKLLVQENIHKGDTVLLCFPTLLILDHAQKSSLVQISASGCAAGKVEELA